MSEPEKAEMEEEVAADAETAENIALEKRTLANLLPPKTKNALVYQVTSAKTVQEYNRAIANLANAQSVELEDYYAKRLKTLTKNLKKTQNRLRKAQKKMIVNDVIKGLEVTEKAETAQIADIQQRLCTLNEQQGADRLNLVMGTLKNDLPGVSKSLHDNLAKSMGYYKTELAKLEEGHKVSQQKKSIASRIFMSALRLIPGAADAFADAEITVAMRRKALAGMIKDTERFMGKLEEKFPEFKPREEPTAEKTTEETPTAVDALDIVDEIVHGHTDHEEPTRGEAKAEPAPAVPSAPAAEESAAHESTYSDDGMAPVDEYDLDEYYDALEETATPSTEVHVPTEEDIKALEEEYGKAETIYDNASTDVFAKKYPTAAVPVTTRDRIYDIPLEELEKRQEKALAAVNEASKRLEQAKALRDKAKSADAAPEAAPEEAKAEETGMSR